MSAFAISSNIVNSNKLNISSDISCKNNNGSGGRLWSGAQILRDDKGTPKIEYAQCGSINIEEDIYNLKKGTMLDNTCDCEMIDEKQGEMACPNGKYLSTYYPLLKKASCCSSCTPDGKVKTSFKPDDCSIVFKDKNDKDISCPPNKFLRLLSVNQNNAKLDCCSPKLEGEQVEKHNILGEECKKMGLDRKSCTDENFANLKNKCKEYGIGIENCKVDEVLRVEQKCNVYGMKYFDSKDNKYKNTDSYLTCHADNFDKLDNYCKENSLNTCNFYNVRQSPITDVKVIKNDINNIDKIQDIYEKKLDNLENTYVGQIFRYKPFVIMLSVLCFSIIMILIYFIVKKDSVKKE